MAKRIIIISSFPVCIILAVIAIIFVGTGRGQLAQSSSIESSTANIISLVNAGKQEEADTAVNKLITDYSGDPQLSSAISDIADSYCWHRKYDNAERLYNITINKSLDGPWATKARMNMERLSILKLIEQKKFPAAKMQLDDMVRDFRDEPNLPTAIFHAGQEFFWQRSYVESKAAFDCLIKDYSNSSLYQEAKLWSAKVNICSLIGKAKDEEISAAIDKMISDFAGDSRLTDTLFWISKQYEWTKGASINRNGWMDTSTSVYKRLMQQFGSGQAQWDYKRLNYRMKIFNLMKGTDPIDSAQGGQNALNVAIEEMVTEFTGRPELAGELYWIACGYEEQPDKCSQAISVYERIVRDCPNSLEADMAVLEVRRRIITDTIIAGDMNGAEVLMDEFVADFKNDSYAGTCLGRVAMGYYKKGFELNQEGKLESAKEHFDRSAGVWERITKNNLQTGKNDVYLYFYAACNYHKLGRFYEAVEIYQKILNEWPDFEHGCGIAAAIAWCYENMRDTGQVPKEEINPIIEEAYKAVLENYTGCLATKEVAYRMAGMMLEKGDKAEAIRYYNKFLESAEKFKSCPNQPQDRRVASVKDTIANLGGAGK